MNGTSDIDNDTPRPVTSGLHPRVYTLLIVLAAWFALAVWSFAGDGVVDYLLFIVSGFVYIAVQILLPIGAAAVGMTAIGIVFHIAEHAHVLSDGCICSCDLRLAAAGRFKRFASNAHRPLPDEFERESRWERTFRYECCL